MSHLKQLTSTPYFKLIKFGGTIGMHALRHRALSTAAFGKLLRIELVNMGPSYIKIGQMLSSREDLLPEPVTQELQLLQDHVVPISFAQIEQTFLDEFSAPMSSFFKSVSPTPIASASIGQVHKAVLLHSQREVVIKVQRPALDTTHIQDIMQIKNLLDLLNRVCNVKIIEDLHMVLQECVCTLDTEIDFLNEKNNALSCYVVAKEFERLRIPRVYSKLTSKRVIVMEYCPGIKINDLHALNTIGVDKDALARDLFKIYVVMLTKYGYLHGDPHPGNIAIDITTKQIILYDFGIFARYDQQTRNMFTNLLVSIGRRDIEGIMTHLLTDQIILMKSNTTRVEELNPVEYMALYELIAILLTYIDDLNMERMIVNMKRNTFIDSQKLPFVLHGKILLILKTFGTLEGVCRTLNPTFKYRDYIFEIGKELLFSDAIFDKIVSDLNLLVNQRGAVQIGKSHGEDNVFRERVSTEAHTYIVQTYIEKQNKLLRVVMVLLTLSLLM